MSLRMCSNIKTMDGNLLMLQSISMVSGSLSKIPIYLIMAMMRNLRQLLRLPLILVTLLLRLLTILTLLYRLLLLRLAMVTVIAT